MNVTDDGGAAGCEMRAIEAEAEAEAEATDAEPKTWRCDVV
jgi:hypothetical protein